MTLTNHDRWVRNAWLEDALLRVKSQCRDDHGRFASCGLSDERSTRRRAAGKHRRQKRRRKVRGREHAGWIRHFRHEDRELGRDIKRERRQLRREQRKERREQRRDHRRAIRDMHREYPRSGSRRGSQTRLNVADQIRSDRAALREDHAAARAQQRADHQSTVESHHRDQRESHADVLREVRRDRQDEREAAGKSWRKAVSPQDEIPTAHDLATRAAKRAGLYEGWRDGTLTGREALDVLHALRLECRAILRGWAADLVESLNPDYERPTKGLLGAARAKVGKFFGKVRGFVKEAFVAGVLTFMGPHFNVQENQPVNDAIAAAVIDQEKYLKAFEDDILTERKPLDGTTVSRAEQYGGKVWATAQTATAQIAVAKGEPLEVLRVHIGPDRPCDTCRYEIGRGWVPIEDARLIGDSECMNACHCHWVLRVVGTTAEFTIGRGPLFRL